MMKKNTFLKILLTSGILIIGLSKPASAKIKDFSCQFKDGRTIATVEMIAGKINLIDWHKNYHRISNYTTPGSICQEVSARMSKFASLGSLNYISVARFDNRYFVCASDRTGKCIANDLGLLFTIQSNYNPQIILKELFGNIPDAAIVRSDRLVIDFNRLLESKLPGSTVNRAAIRYRCIDRGGTPISVADTDRGTIELIVWKSTFFAASGYTPNLRCEIVSQRFQKHSDANNLQYVSFGRMNQRPIICVSDRFGNCKNNGLLLTLEPRDNPERVLGELFDLTRPVTRGGRRRNKTVFSVNRILEQKPVITRESQSN